MLKSTDRGDHWTAISPDLTKGKPNPQTAEGATITTIAQSPRDPKVLWAGTDDGNVNVSRDEGASWTNVADRLTGAPRDASGRTKTWVSRIEASRFDASGRVRQPRRPSRRRFPGVSLSNARLRRDLGVAWRHAAAGVRQRRARGPARTPSCCSPAPSGACTPRSTADSRGWR